jgi:hypothetical protein
MSKRRAPRPVNAWSTDGEEILPMHDSRQHVRGSPDCPCKPHLKFGYLVHHAFDKRPEPNFDIQPPPDEKDTSER